MSDAMLIASAIFMLIGASFTLVAAIGLLRLPDLYTRTHAASKAGTLGSGLLLLSLAIFSQELDVAARAVTAFVFFLLTAPVASHLLARSAYVAGYKPDQQTCIEAMKDYSG